MPERYAPEDPREWLNRARSNLVLARMQGEGVYREDVCFNVQQAVEKAIKALLMQRHVQFPYVHDIAELLTVLEATGQEVPQAIRQAERLTRFAVYSPCHYTPHATAVDTRECIGGIQEDGFEPTTQAEHWRGHKTQWEVEGFCRPRPPEV